MCIRIWYLSFYFWLTSLCIIGSRFIHLIRTDSNAFLFMAESIVYMYHNFFIHSSVDGHLRCFHVLAIVNSAVLNNGIYVSFSILVSSGYMPRSGIISGFLVLLYWSICVFLCWYFMSRSFDYGGFVGNFEVVKCEFFNFVVFKDYFGSSGSLELWIQDQFVTLTKKSLLGYDQDGIKFIDWFGGFTFKKKKVVLKLGCMV